MTIKFGCIADDFTGATDIAGIIARSGTQVNLRIGIPANNRDLAPFEVIALKCRTEPVDKAVSEALAALNWLRENGASRFFWKYCSTFDSTPDGNIGPVAEALMDALKTDQTIYCPAFPENGRSIYMNMLFVGDQPLSESPMKHHPLTPMTDSNLIRLLQPQVTQPVGGITLPTVRKGNTAVKAALKDAADKGTAHIVVDAVEAEDLATIVDSVVDFPLITGGSALALHLPSRYEADGLINKKASSQTMDIIEPGQLALSGSCSAMTLEQVERYRRLAATLEIDPLALASDDDTFDQYCDWVRSQSPAAPKLILASATPDRVQAIQRELGQEKAGTLIENCLASLALVAFDAGVRRFVVAGGETSGAITQKLGITQLQVFQEIAPGVPWTVAQCQGESVALALKSGNFGSRDFFSEAFTMLEKNQTGNT